MYDIIRQRIEVDRLRLRENIIPVRPRTYVRPHPRRSNNINENQNQENTIKEDYLAYRNHSQEGLLIQTENLHSTEPNNLVNGEIYQSDDSVE